MVAAHRDFVQVMEALIAPIMSAEFRNRQIHSLHRMCCNRNREKDMIIIEPTQAVTAQAAFSVNSSPPPIKGRYVYANPFCKHFNIRVTTTQKFIDPTIDAAGRLYLKLRETISVTRGPRAKKKAL